MRLPVCAPGVVGFQPRRQLSYENLECRRLLTANQMVDLQDLDYYAASFANKFSPTPALTSDTWKNFTLSPIENLPTIPLDDSLDPIVDCPFLDDDFCLPNDIFGG